MDENTSIMQKRASLWALGHIGSQKRGNFGGLIGRDIIAD